MPFVTDRYRDHWIGNSQILEKHKLHTLNVSKFSCPLVCKRMTNFIIIMLISSVML